MNKKIRERECFESAIKIGCSRGDEETKKIMQLYNVPDVVKAECPDFIRINEEKNLLLGVEHFRIDQCAIKLKDNRIGATGVMYNKEMENVYNKWRNDVLSSDEVPDGAITDIMRTVTNQIEREYNANYTTFICSFKYVLNKHVEHLDNYWKKLKSICSNTKNIKMAFLMEIYTNFDNIYLNHYNRVVKNDSGLMPFYRNVYELLDQIPKDKVQYFILCLKNYNQLKAEPKVIALSNNDFRKNIRKHQIKVYEYTGIDCSGNLFEKPNEELKFGITHRKDSDNVIMRFEIPLQLAESDMNDFLNWNAVKLALEAKNMGKPFVCDRLSQRRLYVYGNYIIGWKKIERKENVVHVPILKPITKQKIQRKNDEFSKKFGIEREYKDE